MPVFTKRTLKILGSATLLGVSLVSTSVFAAGEATVDLTYKTYTQLTEGQKALVKQGTPNETIVQGLVHYTLVYDKVPTTAPSSSSSDMLPSNQGSSVRRLLPSTGEAASILPVLMGLGLLSLAGWLVYRNKKTGSYLLVAVLAVGGVASTVSGLEAVRRIGDVVTQQATQGTVFTYQPEEQVEGYDYVGYIVVQEAVSTPPSSSSPVTSTPPSSSTPPPSSTPKEKTGSVVVQYKLEDGTEIKSPYTDTNAAPLGTAYNTAENDIEKPTEISHNGRTYVYKSVQGSETGTVVEGQTTVTYIYVEKTRGRVVRRVWNLSSIFDTDAGKLVNEEEVSNDYVGNTYTAAPSDKYVTVLDFLKDQEVIITKENPKFAELKAAHIQKMRDYVAQAPLLQAAEGTILLINSQFDPDPTSPDLPTLERFTQATEAAIRDLEQDQREQFFIMHTDPWHQEAKLLVDMRASDIEPPRFGMASYIFLAFDKFTLDLRSQTSGSGFHFNNVYQGGLLNLRGEREVILDSTSSKLNTPLRQYSYQEVLAALDKKIAAFEVSDPYDELRGYRMLREEFIQQFSATSTTGIVEEDVTYVDYFIDINAYWMHY